MVFDGARWKKMGKWKYQNFLFRALFFGQNSGADVQLNVLKRWVFFCNFNHKKVEEIVLPLPFL